MKTNQLQQAAEQFLAACKDGSVDVLLDYFEEIFADALGYCVDEGCPNNKLRHICLDREEKPCE